MNQSTFHFLNMLKAALAGQRWEPVEEILPEQWQQIFRLAKTHKVLPLIFETVGHLPNAQPARLAVRQQVLSQTVKTCDYLALNRAMRQAGVRVLVVKGIVCRSFYPNPDCRISADEDLLVAPEQYEKCCDVLRSFGMVAEADENAYEISWRKPDGPLFIELHRSLFSPESVAYGDLNRFFEDVFDRAVEVEIQEEQVLTMNSTDHLFYLICHAFKHFLHSGFGIRQVCDMVMLANRYDTEINWEQIAADCQKIRAEKFAAAVFRIGEKDLGLKRFPAVWENVSVDETALLEDMLDSGIYGGAQETRLHSSNITLGAVADQKRGKKGGKGLAKSLFPPERSLSGRYPYLKKYPILLPAAWVSRMASYGAKKALSGNAAESLKIGAERVVLLKQYGILD